MVGVAASIPDNYVSSSPRNVMGVGGDAAFSYQHDGTLTHTMYLST